MKNTSNPNQIQEEEMNRYFLREGVGKSMGEGEYPSQCIEGRRETRCQEMSTVKGTVHGMTEPQPSTTL